MDQDSEEDEEDGEEDEDEPPRRKWQGIEAIFEAYQEHIEGTVRGEGAEGCGKESKSSSLIPSVWDLPANPGDSEWWH